MSDYKQTKTLVINGKVVTINSMWGNVGTNAKIPQTANYGEPFSANICVEYLQGSDPQYDGWTVYDGPYTADYAVAYGKEKLPNQDDYCYPTSTGIYVPAYLKRADYVPYSAKTSAGNDWWTYNNYIFPKEPTGTDPMGAFIIPHVSASNGLMVFANVVGDDVLDATPSGDTQYDIHYYNLNKDNGIWETFGGSYTFNHAKIKHVENMFVSAGRSYFVIKSECPLIENIDIRYDEGVTNLPFGSWDEDNNFIWSAKYCTFKNCSHLPINKMYQCEVTGGKISAYGNSGYANKCDFSGVDLDSYGTFKECNITGKGYYNHEVSLFENCNLKNVSFSYSTQSAYNCYIESDQIYNGRFVNCTISGQYVYPNQLWLQNCTVNGVYYAQTTGMG